MVRNTGAGEPLLKENRELTIKIIKLAASLKIKEVTIFITGDIVDEELAIFLHSQQFVKIMVKWNSLNPDVQNKLVGDKSGKYFKNRQIAWEKILTIFNQPSDRERLGLVTSILADNWNELPNILSFAQRMVSFLIVTRYCPREEDFIVHSDLFPTKFILQSKK